MTLVQVAGRFSSEIEELKDAIFDAEESHVKLQTLQNVVELSVLRTYSLLEGLFEEIFYQTLLGSSGQHGAGPVLAVANQTEVDLLLYRHGSRREKYLDWLPYSYTLERAEALLVGAVPFSRLKYRSVERRALDELVTVRNAIAHPSGHAQARFVELADSKKYPGTRPAEYLLSLRGGQPEVLLLLTRIEVTAQGLAVARDSDANAVLEPETPFFPQQRCPAGSYRCEGCDATRVLTEEQVIGTCAECSAVSECLTCGRKTFTSANWRRTFSS